MLWFVLSLKFPNFSTWGLMDSGENLDCPSCLMRIINIHRDANFFDFVFFGIFDNFHVIEMLKVQLSLFWL